MKTRPIAHLLTATAAALTLAACAATRGPAAVGIPAGEFLMGDATATGGADERPAHRVSVPAFGMAAHEVTVGEFRRFVDATGYRTDAERDANGREGCSILEVGEAVPTYRAGTSWRDPGYAQTERHPVVCVSFDDAAAYVAWLATSTGTPWRLPTEAEWEYAARAGTTTPFTWGAADADACRHANGADATPGPDGRSWPLHLPCSDGAAHAAPVGSYAPNAWGLFDMVGNAWEFTADCYRLDYVRAPVDGSAYTESPCAKHAMRGGAWPYPASFLRVTNRGGSPAAIRANDRGFRLAR